MVLVTLQTGDSNFMEKWQKPNARNKKQSVFVFHKICETGMMFSAVQRPKYPTYGICTSVCSDFTLQTDPDHGTLPFVSFHLDNSPSCIKVPKGITEGRIYKENKEKKFFSLLVIHHTAYNISLSTIFQEVLVSEYKIILSRQILQIFHTICTTVT